MDTIIQTKIFATWKALRMYILFSVGGIYLSLFFVLHFHLPEFIAWIAFIVFIIMPALLRPLWKKKLTNVVEVIFSQDFIRIKIFSNKSDVFVEKNYQLNDIRSFNAIESTNDDSSVLKLFFKNGKKDVYTFLNQDKSPDDSILNNIHKIIHQYNNQHTDNRITPEPSLFASKNGYYYILLLSILLAITLIIQILYQPKTIPLSILPGLLIYLQILGQRKQDKESFEKFNNP